MTVSLFLSMNNRIRLYTPRLFQSRVAPPPNVHGLLHCLVLFLIYVGKSIDNSVNLQIFLLKILQYGRKILILLPDLQHKRMNIQEILNKTDRFAAQSGCHITEVDGRHACAVMKVTQQHLNGGNVCQGGALFTLADLAIAALMNYSGQLTFGIQNSIMFVSSAKEGDVLTAEAVSVCDHHKIPSVEVRVTNQDGNLICHVTGVGYRKRVSVPTEEP